MKGKNDQFTVNDMHIGGVYICALSMKYVQYLGDHTVLHWNETLHNYDRMKIYDGMVFFHPDRFLDQEK